MNENLKITLPPLLRQLIINCRASYEAQMVEAQQVASAHAEQILETEAVERELSSRIAALRPQAMQSDEKAGALANAESRLRLAQESLAGLRATPAKGKPLDVSPASSVAYEIVLHWTEVLPQMARERLAVFGLPGQSPIITAALAQCEAFHCLTIIRDYHRNNLDDIFTIFDRALRGQVNLSKDAPAEADAAVNQDKI